MHKWGARALAALATLLLALDATRSQMPTNVETLSDTCDEQLDSLWGNYTNPPVSPVAGCNKSCLASCYDTLNWAVYSENMQDCPLQKDIIRCMHVSPRSGVNATVTALAGPRAAGVPIPLPASPCRRSTAPSGPSL